MYPSKIAFLIITLLVFCFKTSAQEDRLYSDYEEAKKNAAQVCQLELEFWGTKPEIFLKLDSFEIFPNLTTLIIEGDFSKFPMGILKIKNLKKLVLNGYNIQEIPSAIKELKYLEHLDLSHNELRRFPEGILSLNNLTELNLSINKIRSLPNDLSALKSIKKLLLSLNYINELPSSIGEMTELQTLDCSFCELKTIPESITNLQNLKILNLMYNNLEQRDSFLVDLAKRVSINLLGNDFDQNRRIKKFHLDTSIHYLMDSRDCNIYKTIQINDQTWMCENLRFASPNSLFNMDSKENVGRSYLLQDMNAVCPEGWHNATAQDWHKLFQEVLSEFPNDPQEIIHRQAKLEKKAPNYPYRDDPFIMFDPNDNLVKPYVVKAFVTAKHHSINEKIINTRYDNFYDLNIILTSYKNTSSPKSAVYYTSKDNIHFTAFVFYEYSPKVDERVFSLKKDSVSTYPVRCVKD